MFEPEPGMRVYLDKDEVIEFLPLEKSGPGSVFVYAESGKEGTVYKVLKNQAVYALKVFYPEYRDIRLLENTEKLTRFKDLEGFRVAERNLIEPDEYPDLIRQYPELRYSVLMPWIEGTIWGNLMLDPEPSLSAESYLQIAMALIRVVNNLEMQGLAHCDLSNNNFIITESITDIQLVDVEGMFAPDMPRPIPDISYGTPGYRTPWIAQHGLWGPESDRFAIAILCSEILTWHNQEVRENRAGNASFFDEKEIGEESDRYKLITRYLEPLNIYLPKLLEKAWRSNEFAQCPTIFDWFEVINNMGKKESRDLESSPEKMNDHSQSPTVIHYDTESATDEKENRVLSEIKSRSLDGVSQQGGMLDASIIDASETRKNSKDEGKVQISPDSDFTIADVDSSRKESIAQKKDITISRGVPAKLEVSIEILDFGIVGMPENTQQLSISNTGGAPLVVSIQPEEWINISHPRLTLLPDKSQIITATINEKFPSSRSGREYRTAIALVIDSNVGAEIIGARFVMPKSRFFASGMKLTSKLPSNWIVIIGSLFIIWGGFILLQAMGIIGNPGSIFWGIILGISSGIFFYVLRSNPSNRSAAILSFSLFGITVSVFLPDSWIPYSKLVILLFILLGFLWMEINKKRN